MNQAVTYFFMISFLCGCSCSSEESGTVNDTFRGQVSGIDAANELTGKLSGIKEFTPVDTSRLMALPYPYHLVKAFPSLSFAGQRPLQMQSAPDKTNRHFVVCQEGRIYVFPPSVDTHKATVFLDLRDRISRKDNEEGLLGLAFHPAYPKNGELFIYYSADDDNGNPKSVISRFHVSTANPDEADADSEHVILEIPLPHRTQHGGSMEFGPDGCLYIGLGDGGSANDPEGHGQNLKTLLGSILRIDIDHKDPGKGHRHI